jgi:hypothetical protein
MNPGYLSLLLISISLILLASGWKEHYARSISHYGVLLFFIGWFIFSRLHIEVYHVHVNLAGVWIAAISLYILWKTNGFVQKVHLLSIGLLLGSFHFLLQEILMMDPVMVIIRPDLDTALFLVVLVLLLQRKAPEQLACLSIALLMGDFYHEVVHHASVPPKVGGPSFQDQWWLSVFTARTGTILIQSAYSGCKGVIQAWLNRKGGWKK